MERISVVSKEAAWVVANRFFPTDYDKDEQASANAGYPIYRHHELNPENKICDLGCRLEVNLGNETINIWIENPEADDLAEKVKELTTRLNDVGCERSVAIDRIGDLEDLLEESKAEIVALKAKLYDLIVGGKN